MKSVAAANTASMFQDLALIGALAERHFGDPPPDYAGQLVNITKPSEKAE